MERQGLGSRSSLPLNLDWLLWGHVAWAPQGRFQLGPPVFPAAQHYKGACGLHCTGERPPSYRNHCALGLLAATPALTLTSTLTIRKLCTFASMLLFGRRSQKPWRCYFPERKKKPGGQPLEMCEKNVLLQSQMTANSSGVKGVKSTCQQGCLL